MEQVSHVELDGRSDQTTNKMVRADLNQNIQTTQSTHSFRSFTGINMDFLNGQ